VPHSFWGVKDVAIGCNDVHQGRARVVVPLIEPSIELHEDKLALAVLARPARPSAASRWRSLCDYGLKCLQVVASNRISSPPATQSSRVFRAGSFPVQAERILGTEVCVEGVAGKVTGTN
jgi:hypothetical protein